MKLKYNFSGFLQNAMCGGKLTLHLTFSTPFSQWNMVVAASYCDCAVRL